MEKLRLSLEEVPLIGHYTTKSGLKVHPEKVQAALEMQRPTDARSLLRFNGTVQYLAKFLLRLSDLSLPLRQLTHKNAEWVWSEAQEKAWNDIKAPITQAPVLRFYSLNDEVTLQCDASQAGLGAALLQLRSGGKRGVPEPECRSIAQEVENAECRSIAQEVENAELRTLITYLFPGDLCSSNVIYTSDNLSHRVYFLSKCTHSFEW